MNQELTKIGYIYIRRHSAYEQYRACKLGRTKCLKSRNETYKTGEIESGYFYIVYKIFVNNICNKNECCYFDINNFDNILEDLEYNLHTFLKKQNLNIYNGAGTEFYKLEIIDLIDSFLINNKVVFIKIDSPNEINELLKIKLTPTVNTRQMTPTVNTRQMTPTVNTRPFIQKSAASKIEKISIKKINSFNNQTKFIRTLMNASAVNESSLSQCPQPRSYQSEIIDAALLHFQKYDKGILLLMCGIGKTLISLWIAQRLNCKRLLIGVPNLVLLNQWKSVILQIFNMPNILLISGNITISDITEFLNQNDRCILITTYASAHKVYSAIANKIKIDRNYKFCIKINDEVHHLTTQNIEVAKDKKAYIKMLNIPAIYKLSLTATLKIIDTTVSIPVADNKCISNIDTQFFGNVIEERNLIWAIKQNIICDYVVQTIITDIHNIDTLMQQMDYKEETVREDFTNVREDFTNGREDFTNVQPLNLSIDDHPNRRLFFAALSALQSIKDSHSHHILIYTNNKQNSKIVNEYLKKIIALIRIQNYEIYYNIYNSETNKNTRDDILINFETAKYGILTCVYCLGEGWDLPKLDAVVFAENMTSNIRIVQSALRASRKHIDEPNKITKIILPIINISGIDWLDESSFDFKKIREVIYYLGLEDETIMQKIKLLKFNIEKSGGALLRSPAISLEECKNSIEQLSRLNYSLQTMMRPLLGISYEKTKKLIATKQILNKQQYYDECKNDIRLPEDPHQIFKQQFISWIDYLGIDRIYYNIEECKTRINELVDCYTYYDVIDLSILCKQCCELDPLFPPADLWCDYYEVPNLRYIFIKKPVNKKISIKL